MLLWNSRDRVRALRTQYPATRSARGRSFGPIKTSATTPISSNSDQPISKSMGNEQPCAQYASAERAIFSERDGTGNLSPWRLNRPASGDPDFTAEARLKRRLLGPRE